MPKKKAWRKNGLGQKVKPFSPTKAIDVCIGKEENNRKQKEEQKKETGMGLQPNYLDHLGASYDPYGLYIFIYYLLNNYLLLPPQGQYTSYHEMSYSKRGTKLKKEKKNRKYPPLCPISCRLSYRWTSTLQGLHIAVATHHCSILSKSGVHPPATPNAFPLTNPHHSLLSWTILPAYIYIWLTWICWPGIQLPVCSLRHITYLIKSNLTQLKINKN